MNSSATSSSCRPRCATRFSCSRRRPAASRVFLCRAGARTGPRIRCRSFASSARWAMSPMPRARRSCAARSAGWSAPKARGVATIIEMVAMTRFDCMIGSSAGMRMATSQAIDHCRQRKAFGALLVDQPIMTAVLADLAIEAEAALALTMRIARALDHRDAEHEDALVRLGSAIGKYWICKRAPGHAYEALECVGGSGVMEDLPMPRLYREAPVNAIWEGSGNVQCLDIARAIARSPADTRCIFRRSRFGEGRKRGARPPCRGAQGRHARPIRLREPRPRPLRPARARASGGGAHCAPARQSPEAFCRARLELKAGASLRRPDRR